MRPSPAVRADEPSRETTLAMALGRAGDDQLATAALASTREPCGVWDFAVEQDLGPFLAWRLLELGLPEADPWRPLDAVIRRACALARAEAEWRTRCAAPALEALSEAGLKPVPIKGLWLAERHYPRPWCRRMVDADLVLTEDPGRILAELAARGVFPRTNDPAIIDHTLRGGPELSVSPRWPGAIPVDLHFRLYPDLPLGAVADVVARAEPGACVGVHVHTPHLADHLVLVAHHAVLGIESPPWRVWLDVDRMARDVVDWGCVIDRSIAWSNPAILVVALARASRLFDTPIPDWVWSALDRALVPSERPVVASELANGTSKIDRDALLLCQCCDRRAGWRPRSIASLLWPHPGFVARRLKVASTDPRFWVHRVRFAGSRLLRAARAFVKRRI